MHALGYVTAGWAGIMALSPLLQVRRMLEERSSASVSLGYFGLLCVGFVLWILYGVGAHNPVLIAPNAAAFAVGMLTIGVAVRLRRSS